MQAAAVACLFRARGAASWHGTALEWHGPGMAQPWNGTALPLLLTLAVTCAAEWGEHLGPLTCAGLELLPAVHSLENPGGSSGAQSPLVYLQGQIKRTEPG